MTRTSPWRTILIFGIVGGALVAVLQLVGYRYLLVEHSFEIYGALVAAIFAAVGIWLGSTIVRTREVVREIEVHVEVPAAPAAAFTRDDAARARIGVTERELEVLALIAQGLSTREMAERLHVSENTVKTHASRVFAKLGARRRTQAVQLGKELRLIP
jgi:DNA-binding NarL/FixJ family response regulator